MREKKLRLSGKHLLIYDLLGSEERCSRKRRLPLETRWRLELIIDETTCRGSGGVFLEMLFNYAQICPFLISVVGLFVVGFIVQF